MFLVEMSVGLGGGSASLQADALDFPGVTASISFANPAVTVARSLSDTFSGIVPAGVVACIITAFAAMVAALLLTRWLWPDDE